MNDLSRVLEELQEWMIDLLSIVNMTDDGDIISAGQAFGYFIDEETSSFILKLPSTGMRHVVYNKDQLINLPIGEIKLNIKKIVQEEIRTATKEVSRAGRRR